ncbi:hypothetical protein ABPG74_019935 [Tetrahymena malaccensis]
MQRIQNDESDFLKYSVGGSEILKKSVDLNDTTIKRERRNGENQNVNELHKQDQQLEICFDEDIQELILMLIKLKQNNINKLDQAFQTDIENLIQNYKNIFDLENTQTIKNLPYQEQKIFSVLKEQFKQRYENYICEIHDNGQSVQKNNTFLNEKINEEIWQEISCLIISLSSQSSSINYSVAKEQNETSFKIELNTDKLNLLNGSFLIFIASNLKNSKKLRLIGEIEENNDLEDEDYIGNAIQSIQQKYPITIQLCLDISDNINDEAVQSITSALQKCQIISELNLNTQTVGNSISDEAVQSISSTFEKNSNITSQKIDFSNQITQDTKNDLDETQIQSDYQLGNKENDCYLAQDFFKGLMQKCESLFQNKEDNQNYYENILFFEDVRQSKSQIEKIREIFSNVLKGNHQAITLCQNSIRNCYMSLLEINKKKKPKNDDYLTIKYLNNIGYCSLQLNEYSNSLKYYLESFGLLSQQKEENENLIFQKNQALLYLFINYQLIGDKQKAEQYRQKDPLFEKQAEKELIKFQTRKIEKK